MVGPMSTNTIPDTALWQARIVIGGIQEQILYTQIKASEERLDEALRDLKHVLVHAVSVKKQWTVDPHIQRWNTLSPLGLMP